MRPPGWGACAVLVTGSSVDDAPRCEAGPFDLTESAGPRADYVLRRQLGFDQGLSEAGRMSAARRSPKALAQSSGMGTLSDGGLHLGAMGRHMPRNTGLALLGTTQFAIRWASWGKEMSVTSRGRRWWGPRCGRARLRLDAGNHQAAFFLSEWVRLSTVRLLQGRQFLSRKASLRRSCRGHIWVGACAETDLCPQLSTRSVSVEETRALMTRQLTAQQVSATQSVCDQGSIVAARADGILSTKICRTPPCTPPDTQNASTSRPP